MLKITQSVEDNIPCLRFEGKLTEPWLEACHQARRAVSLSTPRILLDLSAITFIDAAGIRLLQQWIEDGLQVAARSNFVAELLQLETSR